LLSRRAGTSGAAHVAHEELAEAVEAIRSNDRTTILHCRWTRRGLGRPDAGAFRTITL
jgi:hypothetical protein